MPFQLRTSSAAISPAICGTFAVTCALLIATDAHRSPAAADNILAPIWTGAYAGLHGGANWIDLDIENGASANTEDVTFGGHLGFSFGLGAIVIGVEGDLNYENASFDSDISGGESASADVRASGTLRGRVGVPFGPVQFYATAGYAWTDMNLEYRSSSGISLSGTDAFNGIVYGIGAEAFVMPRVSVRLEALRFDYESKNLSISGAAATADEFDPSSTVVRAGVSFRFN